MCGACAAAATNMLAISFARKDKDLAGAILSDALAIAAVLGLLLAGGMYAAAPAYLQRLAGKASAAVVEPAVTYVRIRCVRCDPHPLQCCGARGSACCGG